MHEFISLAVVIFLLDCGPLGLVIGLFGCLPACLDYGILGLMIGLFGIEVSILLL